MYISMKATIKILIYLIISKNHYDIPQTTMEDFFNVFIVLSNGNEFLQSLLQVADSAHTILEYPTNFLFLKDKSSLCSTKLS